MSYNTLSPEGAVGYMRPMFERLKHQGVEIKSVLDIGAAHGHFSGYLTNFWDAEITAVECNGRDAFFLANYPKWDVHYACLGAEACEKTFFIDKNSVVGGGSSFYREHTPFFDGAVEEKKEITTMDEMFDGRHFDLIKIDTQGSELDILRGGLKTVAVADWLLLELSFHPFNDEAPLIDEVLEYTRNNGWKMYDTIGPTDGGHCWGDKKIQVDVLLKNGNKV